MAEEQSEHGPHPLETEVHQHGIVPAPDIMNDPAFDPTPRHKETGEKATEDGDTCRICRGEGSTSEPLFYPCKCSGSIKFVHQECLMEWLSHSQKKHCELCKTPFRFTKLYHPQMPSKVPFFVFVRHGALHVLKSILYWARWNLVILVWLGWVPWCMRMVWRSLFYIGDGGWITPQEIERRLAEQSPASSKAQATSPASSGLSISSATLMDRSSTSVGALLLNTWNTNFYSSRDQPAIRRLWEKIFRVAIYPLPELTTAATNFSTTSMGHTGHRSPSLLSEYQFLHNLTRSPIVNNLAIDIIEGQLITLLVVVGFILVFLIREWVVQQQPVVNAGLAMEAAMEAADPGMEVAAEVHEDVLNRSELEAGEHTDEEVPTGVDPPMLGVDELAETWEHTSSGDGESIGSEEALYMQPRAQDDRNQVDESRSQSPKEVDSHAIEPLQTPSPPRPSIPYRGALTRASEIQRTLEEEALVSGQVWPGVDVFMDLWRRAESDPEEVLRIIRADGRENELAWIVSAMTRWQSGLPPQRRKRNSDQSSSHNETHEPDSPGSSWLIFDDDTTVPSETRLDSQTQPNVADAPLPTPPPEAIQPLDSAALHRARTERQQMPVLSTSATFVPHADGFNDQENKERLNEINNQVEEAEQENISNIQPEQAPGAEQERVEQASEEIHERLDPPKSFSENIQNWLWGDIPTVTAPAEDNGEDDEHVVEDLAEEPPFVPIANGQLMIENRNDAEEAEQQDPEVLQAAAEAGLNPNDPEGIEDGEDLEGIMELIGVQGPLIGLVQNGLFSALLIAISFISGIWIPYVMGKVVLVFAANPFSLIIKMPLRWISALADSIVDSLIFLAGCAFCAVDACVHITAWPIGWILPFVKQASQDRIIGKTAYKYTAKSATRLAQTLADSSEMFSESDIPLFSIVAHESLVVAKSRISRSLHGVVAAVQVLSDAFQKDTSMKNTFTLAEWGARKMASAVGQLSSHTISFLAKINFHSNSLRVDFETPQRITPIDYSLARWSTQDRVIAILIGYAFFLFAGSVYLKLHARSNNGTGERRQSALIDILQQAGGVTKVILIISIEMIVFPLYCGALLDIALLPLSKNASFGSRLTFTLEAPLTSTFIHWFIGTCYMFHFALFVSMCRRILRTGVLYFIRDPDDPSFHPVRDVLERNVSTQLKKIAFSALVYGGLVIVCLGAVVWAIDKSTDIIFPIRWTSSAPVLESPVDLLVYNFVMPFALTVAEPATVLQVLYRWWFRTCARWLRLTHFLFGERIEEEMYVFVRDPFKHIRLKDTSSPQEHLIEERRLLQSREIASYYLNGQFVRAPASDQVRLPKGTKTFVAVDELGNRVDGQPDSNDGLHGRNNRLFKKIFIPHHFGLRIAAFLLLLWLFAGVTGVGCTMIPLLFGRWLFERSFPPEFQINDIYAFAVGAFYLGLPLYAGIRYYPTIRGMVSRLLSHPLASWVSVSMLRATAERVTETVLRFLRVLYFYGTLGFVLPALTGLLWEMYVVIPLLTLTHSSPAAPYTIRFVQAWTLAIVALKFGTKIILARPDTAPARALRALVNPANRGAGWADPDVRLATRAIVVPALVLLALGLAVPPVLAAGVLRFVGPVDESIRPLVFRFAYPAVLGVGLGAWAGRGLSHGLKAWRERVRDEVFLVGERLHNFGERTATSGSARPELDGQTRHRVEME